MAFTLKKREQERLDKKEKISKILSTFPERFTKNAFYKYDTAVQWWFVVDCNYDDYKYPTTLLSINKDEPSIIYEWSISRFWFYVTETDSFDFRYDLKIDEDENGICTNVHFKDMFKNTYSFLNNLTYCNETIAN